MKKILISIIAMGLSAFNAAQAESVPNINVIPYPQSVTVDEGTFNARKALFHVDSQMDQKSQNAVARFARQLSIVTGKTRNVSSDPFTSKTGFIFEVDESQPDEGYSLKVTKNFVKVKASSFNGFLYAIQTIKQMLPVEIYGKTRAKADWKIQCVTIQDQPRFAYRGMHLDVCRHFFSVDEVKKYLDIMAIYKVNTFHWHLTEDQGWRIEIKKYPKLTEIGAYRNGTMIGHDASSNDGIRYGGFYTQEQIKDIVAYAADLGITVIPEVDLPGHMVAALASYPWLGCTGGPYKVRTTWGIDPDVLCPGKESTFTFIEDVLTEVMELFPSQYINIGGDECPKVRWEACPDCQKRIAELGIKGDSTYSAGQYLQNYVTARVQKFINDHGRKIIGWDEILEGKLAPGATVMSWRGVKGGIDAANKGYDAVMSPNKYLYFDYFQSQEKDKEPLCIGGYLPVEKVYGYEPYTDIPLENQKHILGVQANLWTEYIATPEHLEYMLLPRLAALSEIQWCRADEKDFNRFKAAMDKEVKMYDIMGYTYCKDMFGVIGLPGHEQPARTGAALEEYVRAEEAAAAAAKAAKAAAKK